MEYAIKRGGHDQSHGHRKKAEEGVDRNDEAPNIAMPRAKLGSRRQVRRDVSISIIVWRVTNTEAREYTHDHFVNEDTERPPVYRHRVTKVFDNLRCNVFYGVSRFRRR